MINKKKKLIVLAEYTVQFSAFQVVTPLVTWPMNKAQAAQTKIKTLTASCMFPHVIYIAQLCLLISSIIADTLAFILAFSSL